MSEHTPLAALRVRGVLLTLLCVLTIGAAYGHLRGYAHRSFVPLDLRAFYCAGRVVRQRADPYLVQPLLACEQQVRGDDSEPAVGYVMPAPLPPYALAPLAALAGLTPHGATLLFGALLLLATLVIAYCLARMSALPPAVALAVAFIGITYEASGIGQIAPFAIAALAGSALLLRLDRPRLAALCACLALIQPQFGLPAALALFAFVPRARLVLLAGAVLAALVSVACVGLHGVLEYPSVLAAQARSEVGSPSQYSLTWLVHSLGAGTSLALALGSAWYAGLVAWSLVLLARERAAATASGAIVLVPAAFAVFGGTFVHVHQIAVALLAAVVLLAPRNDLRLGWLAAALLTMPFIAVRSWTGAAAPTLLLALIAVWCVVFFSRALTGAVATSSVAADPVAAGGGDRVAPARRAAVRATVATACIAAYVALLLIVRSHVPAVDVTLSVPHDAGEIASLEWARIEALMARQDRTPLAYYLLVKLPTWLALATLVIGISRVMLAETTAPLRRIPAPGADAR